jgi:hypothetical protein
MEMGDQLHVPPVLPPGKDPSVPFVGHLVGPQSRCGLLKTKEISFAPTGDQTNSWTVQPVACCYTDRTAPAPKLSLCLIKYPRNKVLFPDPFRKVSFIHISFHPIWSLQLIYNRHRIHCKNQGTSYHTEEKSSVSVPEFSSGVWISHACWKYNLLTCHNDDVTACVINWQWRTLVLKLYEVYQPLINFIIYFQWIITLYRHVTCATLHLVPPWNPPFPFHYTDNGTVSE